MKRQTGSSIIAVLAAPVLAVVLASWGLAWAQAKPAKLVIAAVAGNESLGLKAVAPMYERERGIKLEIIEMPYPKLYEKLVQTFQANAPTYDLVMMDDPWMPKFGTEGWLSPLDSRPASRGTRTSRGDLGGRHVAAPRGPVPPRAGKAARSSWASQSWATSRCSCTGRISAGAEDLGRGARQCEEVHKPGSMAGYVMRGEATNPIVADFLPILWSFGGDVFDAKWNVVIDAPTSLRAVKFLVNDLKGAARPARRHRRRRPLAAHGDRAGGYQSTVWPGEVTGIVENSKVSKVIGKVGYIPMPAGPSGKGFGMMGNWMLAIPKASKNGQAGADFIDWVSSAASSERTPRPGHPVAQEPPQRSRDGQEEPLLRGAREVPGGRPQLAAPDRPMERRRDDPRHQPERRPGRPVDARGCDEQGGRGDPSAHEDGGVLTPFRLESVARTPGGIDVFGRREAGGGLRPPAGATRLKLILLPVLVTVFVVVTYPLLLAIGQSVRATAAEHS